MLDNAIHLVGNLTDEPTYYSAGSASRATFRLAATERKLNRETGEYVDGTTLYMDVVAWRSLADHIHGTLHKGDRAVVVGRLRRREYQNAQQEQRSKIEVEADAVGPDLRHATAIVTRTARRSAPLGATGIATGTDDAPLPPEPSVDAFPPDVDEVAATAA
ncbi:MAG TPA: single-stranded DNA-binding protein [Mycobacteriales bacterium]|nr:single-stranded DNA-binding protein [Mycobacteriales bacterium]